MAHNIDDIDRSILRLLQRDASLSVDEISENVSLSRNACWRRVRQMEEAGIIRDRVILVDPGKVGLGLSVMVLIRTNSHESHWLERFRRAVIEMPEITSAHRMSGELDYVLRVRVADMSAYDQFYRRLIEKIPLSDVSASFVMEDIKDTTALPV